MSMSMLSDTDDDQFMADVESEMNEAKKQAERRRLQKGKIRIFRMPKQPNTPQGTRTATIRSLVPFKKCATLVEHGKWPNNYVCIAEFGLECEVCTALCAKHKITREELVKELIRYTTGEKIMTKKKTLIPLWWYEANEGEGGVFIMGEAINPQSPINALHTLNQERYVNPEEGETPMELHEYDITLTQIGEETKRVFQASNRTSKPKTFAHQDKVNEFLGGMELDRMFMKFGYALAIAGAANTEYLEQLQAERKKLLHSKTEQTEEAPVAKKPTKSVADDVNLDLD